MHIEFRIEREFDLRQFAHGRLEPLHLVANGQTHCTISPDAVKVTAEAVPA